MASWGRPTKTKGPQKTGAPISVSRSSLPGSTSCTLLPFGQVVSEKRPGMCQGRSGGTEGQSCLLPPPPHP